MRLVDDLIREPRVTFKLQPKHRVAGWIEFAVPHAHQHRQRVLEAAMIDSHAHLRLGQFREGVLVPDGTHLQNRDGKRASDLGVGNLDFRVPDLDVIAELKVTRLLGEPPDRPGVAQRRNNPQVLPRTAVKLCLIQEYLFSVQARRTGFQRGTL